MINYYSFNQTIHFDTFLPKKIQLIKKLKKKLEHHWIKFSEYKDFIHKVFVFFAYKFVHFFRVPFSPFLHTTIHNLHILLHIWQKFALEVLYLIVYEILTIEYTCLYRIPTYKHSEHKPRPQTTILKKMG